MPGILLILVGLAGLVYILGWPFFFVILIIAGWIWNLQD